MKYSVVTLGCKVNQYESEALEESFSERGCLRCAPRSIRGEELSPDIAPDVCVVNTCTVTQKASMQSRQAIRRAIRSNPDALVIVTGCYAQTCPEDIAKIPGVHCIFGNSEKKRIPELVDSYLKAKACSAKIVRDDARVSRFFQDMPATPGGSRTRSFLKIQDGCDSFCTYCIVPHARGASRSLPPGDVLKKIEILKKAGAREIVLTGIHLGAYGRDLDERTSLYELLLKIRGADLVERVRLSSIEPREATDEIVELAARWEGFCPHFHIPLQSGDDEILKKMNRPYTREFFRDLVLKIKKNIPDAAVGVDCLIGFPGETEKAFRNTFDLIDEIPATYLHVFPFSPRKGTPAWTFPGKVQTAEIKRRCNSMRKLGKEKKRRFFESFVGKTLSVLVEEQRDGDTGMLKAMSSNYIPVLLEGPDEWKNTIRTPTVSRVSGESAVFGDVFEEYFTHELHESNDNGKN